MTKAIAIFLLFIHVYNLIGYKAVFSILLQKASSNIIGRIDKGQFSEQELIELKVPCPLLYHHSWPDYVRYDGEVEVNGVQYNYVKRKFADDTLYLLCIPNEANTRLATAHYNYIDPFNDISGPVSDRSKSSSQVIKAFSIDYYHLPSWYEFKCPQQSGNVYNNFISQEVPPGNSLPLFRPPRVIS